MGARPKGRTKGQERPRRKREPGKLVGIMHGNSDKPAQRRRQDQQCDGNQKNGC
jgi:hypothetical protein